MKRFLSIYTLSAIVCVLSLSSCENRQTKAEVRNIDSIEHSEPDTTIYGVCSSSTTMHTLDLLTDEGKELTFSVNVDNIEENVVKGGMFSGDRLAVTSCVNEGENVATCVINLNTLYGKWTSLDRNFEIVEGGDVISSLRTETKPYTIWKIHNGKLLLNSDTFDIVSLGADTLEVESRNGIYVYTRK